jgi:hypothetical protein
MLHYVLSTIKFFMKNKPLRFMPLYTTPAVDTGNNGIFSNSSLSLFGSDCEYNNPDCNGEIKPVGPPSPAP